MPWFKVLVMTFTGRERVTWELSSLMRRLVDARVLDNEGESLVAITSEQNAVM